MVEMIAGAVVGVFFMLGVVTAAKRVVLWAWGQICRHEVSKADRAKAERREERERNKEWSRERTSRWYEHERRAQILMNEVAREFNANQEAA